MQIEKKYSITNGKQLWRIEISDNEKLYVETRDKEKKEVFFSCFVLENGEPVFENFQFEEKFWIGIERIYKDIIYLHKYPKPDMPAHSEIIAFDSASQKILWSNDEYAFFFVHEDKVYGKKDTFGNVEYCIFDYLTGEKLDLNHEQEEIEKLALKVKSEANYDDYEFPEVLDSGEEDESKIIKLISANLNGDDFTGKVEYAILNNLLFTSVHKKLDNGKMNCLLFVNDMLSGELILSETTNENLELFAADTFFIYKNYLIILKNQNELIVNLIKE